jgi:hypothetical protein
MKYIGSGKIIDTKFGQMPKITYHVNDLKELVKFMEDNEMQFINIALKEKREPSKTGYTHYGEVDLWKPKEQAQKEVSRTLIDEMESDDLPF